MAKVVAVLSGFAMVLMATPPNAAEYMISQKGKKFDPSKIQTRIGDVLVFENDDKVGHTIYSDTPGFEFTIGKQKPGEQDSITLETAGEFEVRCAIHPRMKLSVAVSE